MENIIYLDEDGVNEELINHHGGELKETIERESRNIGMGGEIGGEAGDPSGLFARLRGKISANWEKGSEEEFVYNLTDEIAKFTLLYEVLDQSGATEIGADFDTKDRDNLATDSPIMISAPLIRTPLGEAKDQFDVTDEISQLNEAIEDFAKAGMDQTEEVQEKIEELGYASSGMRKTFSSLSDQDDIYRTVTSSPVDFVMGLDEKNFRTRPSDFPSNTTDYAIIGKITTKFDRGENIQLINFTDLAAKNTNGPHERRAEQRRIQKEIANMINDMLDRNISSSEFELSYPDVELRPLAIF